MSERERTLERMLSDVRAVRDQARARQLDPEATEDARWFAAAWADRLDGALGEDTEPEIEAVEEATS